MVKEKFRQMGKEQVIKVDTPKTEEKTINVKPDAEKAEAPKKKKNIIRVYHAHNASDGGKNSRRCCRHIQFLYNSSCFDCKYAFYYHNDCRYKNKNTVLSFIYKNNLERKGNGASNQIDITDLDAGNTVTA